MEIKFILTARKQFDMCSVRIVYKPKLSDTHRLKDTVVIKVVERFSS